MLHSYRKIPNLRVNSAVTLRCDVRHTSIQAVTGVTALISAARAECKVTEILNFRLALALKIGRAHV